MIRVREIKGKKTNLFMTDEEVKILIEYSKRWSSKFQLMIALALFRGMRVGEVVSVSLLDFDREFTSLKIIFEKSHVFDTLPLIPELGLMVREYVAMNSHLFRDGYLFPYYSSKKQDHMSTKTAEALFSKMRKIIGQDHPSFLDRVILNNGQFRYRIGWYSCRRWFETRVYESLKDRNALANIMRYLDVSTVDTYIDPYELWKKENIILQKVFEDRLRTLNGKVGF
jgi:integrase